MKKIALVTGASGDIGRQIAIDLANDGYIVVINYNNSQYGADLALEEIISNGGEAYALKADISDRAQVDEMVEEVLACYGKIDLLVNNAGIAKQNMFQDITQDEWDRIFDINVKGTFNCTQAVIKGMIANHSGNIINISSIWGISGASCEVAYSTSKAAIIGFTKALAQEVAPSNIRVNCVAPGVIDTKMNAQLSQEDMDALCEQTPLGKIGMPEDVSQAVLFLANDDKAGFITGQIISPNGGFII
ncbi:MAG: SDR family oxidoreductase [Oscillospiraceae bacterium]|nr:SDR family oxidoreductase [Oscillospiraceae bacterium]